MCEDGRSPAVIRTSLFGLLCVCHAQGDRTHAMLIPMAYLTEYQQVVYDAQQSQKIPTPPVLGNLLADLARVGAEPEVITR